ncbi:hypothetical protein [Variovorax sp. DAIF25]|uniref:hypothetical protein n=1 Tax=Variovorax sp. DAIF25 TaxID=3080983 RepID=UPI003D6BC007
MPSEETPVVLSDRDMELVQEVARQRGISIEEAANQLIHEAIEGRFRQNTGRGQARLYSIREKRR